MSPMFETYFHGTKVTNLLSIIDSGEIRTNGDGQAFFSRYTWESCMQYGADRRYRASFVAKVRLMPPNDSTSIFREVPGVRDAVVIQIDKPIPTEVLELYVRRLRQDEAASLEKVSGVASIKAYLLALAGPATGTKGDA